MLVGPSNPHGGVSPIMTLQIPQPKVSFLGSFMHFLFVKESTVAYCEDQDKWLPAQCVIGDSLVTGPLGST